MKQLYKSSLILVILTFALRILAQEPYCTPIYNTGCTYGDGLILFQLGDINQQIQCDGSLFPWYHDYTSISTVIQIDSQYTLTVQSGNSSTYLRVWIDFKNDELFDSAELVVDNLLLSSSQTNFTAPVKIPAGTLPGNHRLRYRTDWLFGVTGACATLEYGNSCDFTLKASPVGIQEFE